PPRRLRRHLDRRTPVLRRRPRPPPPRRIHLDARRPRRTTLHRPPLPRLHPRRRGSLRPTRRIQPRRLPLLIPLPLPLSPLPLPRHHSPCASTLLPRPAGLQPSRIHPVAPRLDGRTGQNRRGLLRCA